MALPGEAYDPFGLQPAVDPWDELSAMMLGPQSTDVPALGPEGLPYEPSPQQLSQQQF